MSPKPTFSPAIIHDLRTRATAHVQAGGEIKLGTLKTLYKRWYNGADPHTHALAMIDGHLISQLNPPLEKARRRSYKRDRRGEFAAGGSNGGGGDRVPPSPPASPDGGGQRRFFQDVATQDQHDELGASNAGYDAFQTNVIPETRYSTFLPVAGTLTGLGIGAVSGARAQYAPDVIDRANARVQGWIGAKIGGSLAKPLTFGIHGARLAARSGIGAINSTFGTTYARPGAHPGWETGINDAWAKGGRYVGEKAALGYARVTNAPGAFARHWGEQRGLNAGHSPRVARLQGRGFGVLAGLAVPGLMWASPLYGAGHTVGPYVDSLFPRHVRKQAPESWNIPDWLFDDPAVLAKQTQLMGLGGDDLIKANVGDLAWRLARALHPGALAQQLNPEALMARLRTLPPSLRRAPPPTPPSGANLARPGRNAGEEAALDTFEQALNAPAAGFPGGRFRMGPQARVLKPGEPAVPYEGLAGVVGHRGRGLTIAAHVAGIGAAGAMVGALTGLGLAQFETKHPRDAHGRFSHARQARRGAAIGAIGGGIIGLGAGLAAARRGNTRLLNQAIERLRESTPDMRAKATAVAREAHANAFFADNEATLGLKPMGSSGGDIAQHVTRELRRVAYEAWQNARNGRGRAIEAGAKAFYRHQLNEAFDTAVRRKKDGLAQFGIVPMKRGIKGPLINRVDVDRLNPDQRIQWDDMAATYRATDAAIEGMFNARKAAVDRIDTQINRLTAEKAALTQAIGQVPGDWEKLRRIRPAPTLEQVRAFAKDTLDHELQASTIADAVKEVDTRVGTFTAEQEARAEQVARQLDDNDSTSLHQERADRIAGLNDDLSEEEHGALVNPFTGKQFENRPKDLDTKEGLIAHHQKLTADAVKPFAMANAEQGMIASNHMLELAQAHEAALQHGIPSGDAGLLRGIFNARAPIVAGRMQQGADDFAAIMQGNREAVQGFLRRVYDWLHFNSDPKQAWQSVKKIAGDAQAYAGKANAWRKIHMKAILALGSALTTVGAIDLHEREWRNKVKVNPGRWKQPPAMSTVFEYPNPISKPHEALWGITYRGQDGKTKLLYGEHIYTAEGAVHPLPPGADLDAVRRDMKGGSGTSPQVTKIDKPELVHAAIARARTAGTVMPVGPEGYEFDERTANTADSEETRLANGIYDQYLKGLDTIVKEPGRPDRPRVPKSASTMQTVPYFHSLAALFSESTAPILNRTARIKLLLGDDTRRGIFKSNTAYGRGNKDTITDALIEQVTKPTNRYPNPLIPSDALQYTNLRRALWTVADHFNLSTPQTNRVLAELDKITDASHQRPADAATATGAADFDAYFSELLNEPAAVQNARLMTALWSPDEQRQRDTLKSIHDGRIAALGGNPEQPDSLSPTQRAEGVRAAREWFDRHVRGKTAATPDGDLAKRVPRIGGAAMGAPADPDSSAGSAGSAVPGPISGASTRVPRAPTVAQDIAASAQPQHAARQVANYGLSAVGLQAATSLATHLLPGGGALRAGARLALQGAGGFAGNQAAVHGVGNPNYGPEQSLPEMGIRFAGGLGGEMGGQALAANAGRAVGAKVAQTAAGQVANRGIAAVGRTVGSAFGRSAAVEGAEGGAATGAELGSVIGPEGTLAGGAIGGLVGGAIGLAGGAVGGYLADEGAGILTRHLSRYGNHVPAIALKTLGHGSQQGQAA